MITVLLGPDQAMLRYCRSLEKQEPGAILFLPVNTDRGRRLVRANFDLRHLLACLRSHLGSEEYEASITRHRVAAAFLLDKVYDDLSTGELERYRELSTDILTHTSHNWYTNSFVVRAWADLFSEMFSKAETKLILPSVQLMSSNFISVLRQVLIKGRPESLQLIVGFGEGLDDDGSEDENGIIWDKKVFSNLRESFLCMSDAHAYELTDEELGGDTALGGDASLATAEPDDFVYRVDLLDSDPESRLDQDLRGEVLDAELGQRACGVLRRMFGAYDFRASLQIGLRILASGVPLEPLGRAFVLTAISISAHNRQFPSASGSEKLNRFLTESFSQALELETDVFTRSVISYRLGVTLARRRKDGPKAMRCIEGALEELRTAFPPSRKRAYYEAWLLNIKAYSHMLLKEFGKSAESVEAAFGLTDKYWNNEEDLTPGELYSSQLFAGNRATLAMYGGDDAALDHWFSRGTEIFETHSEIGKRYVRFLRINILRKRLDLAGAIQAGEEGLADAIVENSAEYQDLYRMNLADLHFRAGDLASTFRYLRDCLDMYVKVGDGPRMTAASLLWAAAKTRQGEIAEADELYGRILEAGQVDDPSAVVDVLSARALLAADLGRVSEAEQWMDQAIEMALDLGERDLLVLVARRSGDALLKTGATEEAREAYLQGLDILGMEAPEDAGRLPDEVVRLHWGLYRCDPQGAALGTILAELPEALREDADLWWLLPELEQAVRRAKDLSLAEHSEELKVLEGALGQRSSEREGTVPSDPGPLAFGPLDSSRPLGTGA